MKASVATPPGAAGSATADERARDLPQYSLGQVLGVWIAVTAPMGILGWVVPPWLSHHIGGRDPFIDALWLRAPRDPRTKRVGGRVWWWLLPFIVVSAGINAAPLDPTGPLPRDFPAAILTDRVKHYFDGNWAGFALVLAVAFLSPIVEELLFRGLLLPRMRGVFGKWDVVASSAAYTLYHVHQPWSMPESFIDGVINLAYPTRRFQSAWMGIVVHTAPSFLTVTATLFLVL